MVGRDLLRSSSITPCSGNLNLLACVLVLAQSSGRGNGQDRNVTRYRLNVIARGGGKGFSLVSKMKDILFQWEKAWCGGEESDVICHDFLCKSFVLYLLLLI